MMKTDFDGSELERLRNLDEALREFIEPKFSGPTAFLRDLKRTGAWTGLAEALAEKLGEARRSERALKAEVARLEAEIVEIKNRWQGDIEP